MDAGGILLLVLGAILVNNVIFAQFLGICPYLGVSKKTETALGMGFAVTFVMTLAVAVTWPLQHFVLAPLGLGYLQTLSFILVIASLVQFVEIAMKKLARGLYESLGVYLPLITTNCAILGVALICQQKEHSYPVSLVFAFASAVGFILAILIFAGIRERMEIVDVPGPLEGVPIAMIIAGILAMGFMGFAGLGG
jgi:Na+-translocating ferredoxin:NAD+ oxidoreductase subunit A